MVLPYPQIHIHRFNQLWIMLYCSIYYWKNSTCNWAHTIQTLVVQVPTIFCCWWNVLHMSVKFISTMVFFKSTITLFSWWAEHQDVLFIVEKMVYLSFLLYYVTISFLSSLKFTLYIQVLWCWVHMYLFLLYISGNISFYHYMSFIIICLYIISSLSLVTVFVLMSILSDVTIASSLYLPFTCDIFFFPFTFSLCVRLKTKMSLL